MLKFIWAICDSQRLAEPLLRWGDLMVFKMAGVHYPEVLKIRNSCPISWRLVEPLAEIWRFNSFKSGNRPSSRFLGDRL